MNSESAAVRVPERRVVEAFRPLWTRLERESGPLSLLCGATAVTLLMLPHQLLLDGWITLVSGREVVERGLPDSDTLTVWTQGAAWVDQQWLAQAAFYGLAAAGGLELVMLGHAALVAATLGVTLLAARRLGGSERNVTLAAGAAALVTPWATQMRTQTLVMPLFAVLLWLLAADSRAPSRRVFLVFPLLVLWANLHGTVVLAAVLVALRGLTGGRVVRRLTLLLGPIPCVLASPYGLDLVGYYERLFLDPAIREIAPEWGASTPSVWTVVFYVVAAATVWLLARRRRRLTRFEQAALVLTLVGAFAAIRSLVWFAIAAAMLVPRLLDERPAAAGTRSRRLRLTAALAMLVASAGTAAAQPARWYTSSWPDAAADRIAGAAAARPEATVFSDGRYAGWLLWTKPKLAGRISHDVRWELYSEAQLRALRDFDDLRGDWRRATAGSEILVLDRRTHPQQIAALRADGLRTLWADERVAVLARR